MGSLPRHGPLRVGYLAVRAQPFDGWGRYTLGLVGAARGRGLEAVLITAEAEVDSSVVGIEHHALLPRLFSGPLGGLRRLAFAPRLRRVLSSCDVVHGLAEPYAPLIAASISERVPYVQTAHGTWAVQPLRARARRWFYARALRRADLLVFQSAYTRDRMAQLIDLPPHVVHPAGVDASAFDVRPTVPLPAWADEGPLVLSVGALRRRKGHHVALEAAARAAKDHPMMHLVIIGGPLSGRYVEQLTADARRLGMEGRLHLMGNVSPGELAAWYAKAEVFMLLPLNLGGTFEGLGLCFLEAAAAGRACLATRDCGAAEAVVDGETGLLVPQDDAEAAAAALLRVLADPDWRRQLGEAGRRHAARFSWAGLADELARSYTRLIEARGGRSA